MPDPLANVADIDSRIGTLTDSQAQRAQALLIDASALVRSYTRQTFTLVEDDQVTLRPVGTTLSLPERPVTAVTQVVAVGGRSGIPDVTLTGWLWDGLDEIDIRPPGWRSAIDYDLELDYEGWCPDAYRVIYSHGYESVPDDVVAVVCGMVNRVLTAPTLAEGLTNERIGNYGYGYAQFPGGQSPGATVRLTDADKQTLTDGGYKRRTHTIQMRT